MKPLRVKEISLGDGSFKIVLTLTSISLSALKEDLEKAKRLSFSLLEWRADYMKSSEEDLFFDLNRGLESLRRGFPKTPIIFTFRAKEEGGQREISAETLLEVRNQGVKSGWMDFLDMEGFWLRKKSSQGMGIKYKTLKREMKKSGIRLILSYHNFAEFPGKEWMIKTCTYMEDLGADLVKMAVVTKTKKDLDDLSLVSKTLKTSLSLPHVLIGMGDEGQSSRFDEEKFYSALTYTSLKTKAAPGQLSLEELSQKGLT